MQMVVLVVQYYYSCVEEEVVVVVVFFLKKVYLDFGVVLFCLVVICGWFIVDMYFIVYGFGEVFVMQSFIKYSGSFVWEVVVVCFGGCGKKSFFGGLGIMKFEFVFIFVGVF